jgi:hypothetical protein
LGADIFGEELNLIDHISTFIIASIGSFLGLFVVHFAGIGSGSWFNSSNVEADSESVLFLIIGVEEIVEGAGWESSVFLVNLGEDNWSVGLEDTGISG